MHPDDLANLIGRELRTLPEPRAPRTLLPRIMAAVQAWSRRPWYQRAWFTWPVALQVATLVVIAAAVAGIVLASSRLDPIVAGASSSLLDVFHPWRPWLGLDRATTIVKATRTLLRAIVQPAIEIRAYLFAIVLLVGAVSAAIGAALGYLAIPRTQQS